MKAVYKMALLLCVVALASACASSKSNEKRYALTQSQGQSKSADQIQQTIIVGPVLLPSELKRSTMAIRQNDGSMTMDDDYKWAGDLDDQLARLIAVELENHLANTLVVTEQSATSMSADYAISFDVSRFDNINNRQARLEASWTINRRQDRSTLAVGRSAHQAPANGSVGDAVQAMSQTAKLMALEIANTLKSHGI